MARGSRTRIPVGFPAVRSGALESRRGGSLLGRRQHTTPNEDFSESGWRRAPMGLRIAGEWHHTKRSPMSSRCSVVVADDNREAADTLVEILGAMGYRAVAVYDGREAVAACAE